MPVPINLDSQKKLLSHRKQLFFIGAAFALQLKMIGNKISNFISLPFVSFTDG